ncbi:MAG: aldehyde dehydrogenase family protein [Sphingobium sp.]
MSHDLQFYIGGAWVDPAAPRTMDVIDPSTEEAFARISMGGEDDVNRAVAAAKAAFPAFSRTSRDERMNLLRRILAVYQSRHDDLAVAMSREMGAPLGFSKEMQAGTGIWQLESLIRVFETFEFERPLGSSLIVKEPIGVVAMITPWNWPINQIMNKVAPAIAAGCTMILKPSEVAPLNAIIFAEILDEAGVPAGVFNLINGDGPSVGAALARHPDVDMISITGSTRAGISVAKDAADTVKRVSQELGGKSANIILRDADLEAAVKGGVAACFGNSGQSCNAPTRMFVPAERLEEAVAHAKAAAEEYRTGPASDPASVLGPVVSRTQFDKIQKLIETGIAEGADLVAGGPGRVEGHDRGYFVKPTIFANVSHESTISREEIFGPVLAILTYETEQEAIDKANDTVYGLAAYVQSGDIVRAREVASRLRAGNVYINDSDWDCDIPFGGYKQSGNGRESGEWGLDEFLEVKAIVGYEGNA